MDFSNVVSIVHDVLKIVIVVANSHYCIELIMKASITMTVPHSTIHCLPIVVRVAGKIAGRVVGTVAVVITSPLSSMKTTMTTSTMMATINPTVMMTMMMMNVWGTKKIVL